MFQLIGMIVALILAGWLVVCLLGGIVAELFGSQFWRGLTFAVVATLLLWTSFRLAQVVLPSWSGSGYRMLYCCIALAIWMLPVASVFWVMF